MRNVKGKRENECFGFGMMISLDLRVAAVLDTELDFFKVMVL